MVGVKGMKGSGGPRPKVREDDARGWNHRTDGQPGGIAYEPNDHHRNLVRELAGRVWNDGVLARRVGIHRDTMLKYYWDDIQQAREDMNELVGAQLLKKALKGDIPALKWWEQSRAGKTSKVQITGPRGGPIQHSHIDIQAMAEKIAAMDEAQWDEYVRTCHALGIDIDPDAFSSAGLGGSAEDPA